MRFYGYSNNVINSYIYLIIINKNNMIINTVVIINVIIIVIVTINNQCYLSFQAKSISVNNADKRVSMMGPKVISVKLEKI